MAAVTMAKVWLVLGLSSALRATQEGGEEISSAVRYAEEDVDCSSLKFVSSEPYDVSHIRKILTHYWETSIGFYDCEECDKNRWNCYWKYYTYFKKHNRFAVLQAHIDSKAKNDAMCATEGWQNWGEDDWRLTLSPKFCSPNSKFSSALREKMAKDARERCKATLCELAKSGEWKNTWFKSKKEAAIEMPWPAKMSSRKGLGFKDAFKEKCWHGPEEMPESLGYFQDFVKHYGMLTASETFNKKVCGCPTEDDCS